MTSRRSGLDFTMTMRRVCQHMVDTLPQLSHIDLDRVAIGYAQTKNSSSNGIHASLTPMRFEHGGLNTQRHGKRYTVQRMFRADGVEILYILTFYMPRFVNVDLHEKSSTVLHELWHISPRFDGDIRRFPGRCYAHSGSQKEYDRQMARMAQEWLQSSPPEALLEVLGADFESMRRRWGSVYGARIKRPKLLPEPE